MENISRRSLLNKLLLGTTGFLVGLEGCKKNQNNSQPQNTSKEIATETKKSTLDQYLPEYMQGLEMGMNPSSFMGKRPFAKPGSGTSFQEKIYQENIGTLTSLVKSFDKRKNVGDVPRVEMSYIFENNQLNQIEVVVSNLNSMHCSEGIVPALGKPEDIQSGEYSYKKLPPTKEKREGEYFVELLFKYVDWCVEAGKDGMEKGHIKFDQYVNAKKDEITFLGNKHTLPKIIWKKEGLTMSYQFTRDRWDQRTLLTYIIKKE